MCASLVSIPVTVSWPSWTECIVTISCASNAPLFVVCLALTVTCIGVPFTAGSLASGSVHVEVVVFCFDTLFPLSVTKNS